jgi:ABC-type sulfate/molybdate transport systems ATPase subunit
MNLLQVSSIDKTSSEGVVLKDINFALDEFQKLVIAGETGSGKSSLLKIIAGLVQPDAGEVTFRGKRVEGPLEKLVPGHPQIAYLSQHFELPKFLRVEQVLSYANHLSDEDAARLYELCQIDHLMKRKTDQLSGGERQRIALARNLITVPSLLLLDEPFSNLDIIHRNTLKEILEDLGEVLKITMVLVSHDPNDTLPWADRIIVMRAGEVVQTGTAQQIYLQPVDQYVAGLFGSYNHLAGAGANAVEAPAGTKFVRPEHLTISLDNKKGLQGVVERVRYYGNDYEVEVKTDHGLFITRTRQPSVKPGDSVGVVYNR